MPAATKKLRAPAELEVSESKAHGAGESPEDEVREGSEDAPRPSRKRGAKNAKRTKAPMDSEGCGCGGKKGGTCDGDCASKRKRSDALTPQEYLTACELGIEQRSRSYIRARLDAAARLDLKCGNGSISPGEKCTKGQAQAVDPKAAAKKEFRTLMNDPRAANAFNKAKGNTEGIGNKIKMAGEFAARIGGGAAIGWGAAQTFEGAMRGNFGEASRGYRNMQLGAAAVQTAAASKAGRMGNKALSKEFLKSAGRQAAIGVGQEAALGAFAGFKRTGGMAGLRRRTRGAYQSARMRTSGMRSTPHGTGWASSAYDRPLRGRHDSIYAAGFSPELDQLAI